MLSKGRVVYTNVRIGSEHGLAKLLLLVADTGESNGKELLMNDSRMRGTVVGAGIIALAIMGAQAAGIYFGPTQTCVRAAQEVHRVTEAQAVLVCTQQRESAWF